VAHVFISYVLQNRDLVDKLANELRNRGVVVWLDRNSIEPGSRWRDAIKKAIRGGKCFMACFSKEYNEREKTYMNEELTTAIDELRERSSDKAWFIPVLINEAPIPSRRISAVEDLSDLQAVRLYEDWDTGINRIFRALSYDDPALVRVWQLVDIAEGPFGDERFRAIEQLGMIRPVMKPAILCLIKAIQGHNDVQIRRAALTALLYMGEEAAEAAAAVAAALRDRERIIQYSASVVLRQIGPAAVPALTAALKDPDPSVRTLAADELARFDRGAAEAVPALVDRLKDSEDLVRRSAARALWRIGPAAVPALTAALKDPDPIVRDMAAWALGKNTTQTDESHKS